MVHFQAGTLCTSIYSTLYSKHKALCREYKLTMQYTVDGHFMTVEGKVNGGKEDAVGRN